MHHCLVQALIFHLCNTDDTRTEKVGLKSKNSRANISPGFLGGGKEEVMGGGGGGGGGGLLSNALQASPDLFSQASLVRQQGWLCFLCAKEIGLPLQAWAGLCLD